MCIKTIEVFLMGNVVCLTTRKNEKMKEVDENPVDEFIEEFYNWAFRNGVDTTTTRFKFDAATVMTVCQALIHEERN